MSGWCPRCDAVRPGDGDCPECGTPLVALERPSQRRPHPAEPVAEVGAVAEAPPSARLRVAMGVAAVVLIGLAFVAGRGTGHGPPRAAAPATTPATTTQPETQPLGQRRLDWRTRATGGITLTALALQRIANEDPDGDDIGQLTIRVQGLPAERRLLALQGLELLDLGGGVFAGPEESPIAGIRAALVQPTGQAGIYVVDLGPTPGVDTLAKITFQGIVLTQPPSSRNRIELDTTGSWPAGPPLRAVEPASDGVTIDLSALDLPTAGGARLDSLPLQVAGAFVGARRAVVTLRVGSGPGGSPTEAPQVFTFTRQVGAFPISARLLAGDKPLCERTTMLGESTDSAPLVVVDCPTTPAPRLAVELAAGAQRVPFRASLPG